MKGIKISIVLLASICIVFITGCTKKEDISNNNIIIKSQVVENKGLDNFDLKKDYKIIEVIKEKNDLFIHVETELEDSKEAFQMGTFISDAIKIANKDKLIADNISNIQVFFNGNEKDMLFNGTNVIKEVSQNWEVKDEKDNK